MPRKSTFTKETIINAAFRIIKNQGFNKLSARSIAFELNSSTMPIFSYLKSMEEIEQEVRKEALRLLIEYQTKPHTENPILNFAVGYIMFSKEEKNLFRFLFVEQPKSLTANGHAKNFEKLIEETGNSVSLENYFGNISPDQMDDITLRTWIFTHGLATVLSNNLITGIDDEKIIDLLKEAGKAFSILSKNKN